MGRRRRRHHAAARHPGRGPARRAKTCSSGCASTPPVTTTAPSTARSTASGSATGSRPSTFPVRGLPRDAQGAVNVTFGLTGSPTEPTLDIARPGVYPLEVALRADETIEAFVTWLVVADPAAAANEFDPCAWRRSGTSSPRRSSTPTVARDPARRRRACTGRPARRHRDTARRGQRAMPLSSPRRTGDARRVDDARAAELALAPGRRTRARRGPRATNPAAPGAVRADRPHVARSRRARRRAPGATARRRGDARSGRRRLSGSAHVPSSSPSTTPRSPACATCSSSGSSCRRHRRMASSPSSCSRRSRCSRRRDVRGRRNQRAVRSPDLERRPAGAARATTARRVVAADVRARHSRRRRARARPAGGLPTSRPCEPCSPAWRATRTSARSRSTRCSSRCPRPPTTTRPVTRNLVAHHPEPFPITAARYATAQRELTALRSTVGADDPDDREPGCRRFDLALSTENTPAQAQADLARRRRTTLAVIERNVSTTGRRVTLHRPQGRHPAQLREPVRENRVTVRVQLASEKLLFPDGADQQIVLPVARARSSSPSRRARRGRSR